MSGDAFENLAPFYDVLMSHVDYDRWFMVTTCLAELLPKRHRHLDAACGTGVFAKHLINHGWDVTGMDLSPAMVRIAKKRAPRPPAVVADLRAVPFHRGFDMITCLFDSMNFLLTLEDVEVGVRECAGALDDDGILYFDVVTERMVTEYFEGQEWEEDNATFSSRWRSTYDRTTKIAETRIRVNRGHESVVRERIYELDDIREAVRRAGLRLLAVHDARTWASTTSKTVRVDIVAAKNPSPTLRKRFAAVEKRVAQRLREMDY